MPERHLNARLLDKLLGGEVAKITPDEARELAWHLIDACPECAETAESDWALEGLDDAGARDDAAPAAPIAGAFDEVFARVGRSLEGTVARIRESAATAPGLVDELLRQPAPRQRLLIHNDSRFQALPVAELLLERAWEIGLETPSYAEAIAELVLELIDRVPTDDLSESILDDVRGRTWGYRGNFRRIVADYRGAEEALREAWRFLERGTGDLLERARLLGLESTLCRYRKQRERAGELLDEALRIYTALDEQHLAGRIMITQALLLSEQGEAARAVDVLQEAQKRIDPKRDPRLVCIAQQNLLGYLTQAGQYEEALAGVPSLRHELVAQGTRVEMLRLRWLEGRIHLGRGNEARAEAALLEVRKGMLELGLPKDVAVVSLELAALYLRQQRTGEIRQLASQMFPIFRSRDLHQQAIAALLLFQRAVEMDTLTLRTVEEVADIVRRSNGKMQSRVSDPS